MVSAHTRYVCRLYKQALNTAYDWYPNRLLSRPIMLQIRAHFEANRNESNPIRLQQILRETEDELQKYKHPLPYKCDATQLYIGKTERPVPKPNEILVKVAYFGMNRMDISQREGKYPPPPGASILLGVEISGVVEEIGKDVTQYTPGDRVFGLMGGGGYAEYAIINEGLAAKVGNLSLDTAAAIPEVWCTAYQAIHYIGGIKQGDDVLIHAGASGVGSAAIQLAKRAGAKRIFVTASTKEKLGYCVGLGATHPINYKEEKFVDAVHSATAGRGVDIIVDFIAGNYFNDNIKALAIDGRMSMQAVLGGSKVETELGPIIFKRLKIEGSTLRSRSVEYQSKLFQTVCQEIVPDIESGVLSANVKKTFNWENIYDAHIYMESNSNFGKIVVSTASVNKE
ncbi:hypothetical protein H4219_001713 [Mycoemilia scoparia]|uniref:Enoyl reductase (ER) domain-containing protein n=1 Tax=Mycoemilia scoparia TaxID=417184 RepID=A0A9W7ZZA6_9FUNG|nr:hypothetical protein H4219_001713 [Mycoemilia scoparia]